MNTEQIQSLIGHRAHLCMLLRRESYLSLVPARRSALKRELISLQLRIGGALA